MSMSKEDAWDVGSNVWKVNSFQRQLVGYMVKYVSFNLPNWLSVCEITGHIMADGGDIIDCNNKLGLLLKSFDELERNSFVP